MQLLHQASTSPLWASWLLLHGCEARHAAIDFEAVLVIPSKIAGFNHPWNCGYEKPHYYSLLVFAGKFPAVRCQSVTLANHALVPLWESLQETACWLWPLNGVLKWGNTPQHRNCCRSNGDDRPWDFGVPNSKTRLNLARNVRGQVTQPTEWAHDSFSSNTREVCLHIGPYPSSKGLVALWIGMTYF